MINAFTAFLRTKFFLSFCLLCATSINLFAQFNPSSGTEFGFPTNVLNGRTEHSSCYKAGNMVLAAWDEPSMGGQVIWQLLNGSNLPICQGIQFYGPGVRDIEVGMLAGPNGQFVAFVAYHRQGVGHQVEQFLWNPSACTFVSLGLPVTLSTSGYSRISMDSHKLYGLVIAWEEGSILKSIVYLSMAGVISNSIIHTVPTPTVKISEPDVAFNHSNAGLAMNYVYLEQSAGSAPTSIQVSQAWYWAEYTSTTVAMASTLMDVNAISGAPTHRVICNIDGPDHNWDTWAYAYTEDQMDVNVRIFNGTASTVTMTNGTIPGMATPINADPNTRPTLSYNSTGNNIMVGWHTLHNYPMESYVAAEILFDGSTLTSASDYLEIPFTPPLASGAPTLAFSKMNENTANYLYAFFSELNGGGFYDMKHKFHNMAVTGSFKKNHEHCDDEEHLHELAARMEVPNSVTIYPNPSNGHFSLSAALPVSGNSHLVLRDITGKKLFEVDGDWATINQQLQNYSQDLLQGTYLVRISSPENQLRETIKIQKM